MPTKKRNVVPMKEEASINIVLNAKTPGDPGIMAQSDILRHDEDGVAETVGHLDVAKIFDLQEVIGATPEELHFGFFDDSGALLNLMGSILSGDGNIVPSLEYESDVLVIDNLEIKEPFRRRGLAASAVEIAIDAFAGGYALVAARVDRESPEAYGFWRAMGFKVIREQRNRRKGYVTMVRRARSEQ